MNELEQQLIDLGSALEVPQTPDLMAAVRERLTARPVRRRPRLRLGPRRRSVALGIALAGVINIFNLPMYVVGGGVASAWDAFAPAMMERVRSGSFVYRATAAAVTVPGVEGSKVPDDVLPARRTTIITRALLGSDAGLVGAARLPMIAGKLDAPEAELKRA